jgi:hypothetical protein
MSAGCNVQQEADKNVNVQEFSIFGYNKKLILIYQAISIPYVLKCSEVGKKAMPQVKLIKEWF